MATKSGCHFEFTCLDIGSAVHRSSRAILLAAALALTNRSKSSVSRHANQPDIPC